MTSRYSRTRGALLVEAALVLPAFLLLLFATLDLARLYFTQISLQHALREGGRFGVTGRRLPDPLNPLSLQSRVASIQSTVLHAAVGVALQPEDVTIVSVKGGAGSAGGPGDTFTLSMSYEFNFVTPLIGGFFEDGAYRFRVSTTFRSEPFPPANA